MIADWDTDTLFVSDLLEKKEPILFASLRSVLKDVPIDIIIGTADIWCRDYMPIQLDKGRFCQFVYAPDYLRGYEELITPPDKCRLPFMLDCRQEQLVLDGGNVVASGTKVILTEKVYEENPTVAQTRLRQQLEELFQAECIFIPQDPEDEVGHSDGVVRFVAENRVLMSDCSLVDPGYGDKVRRVLKKEGLEVETLPMFLEEDDAEADFQSAVGVYINFLRVGGVVGLPGYTRPQDQEAVEKARQAMPGATVLQVPCRGLAEKGGVLNCISWPVKANRSKILTGERRV